RLHAFALEIGCDLPTVSQHRVRTLWTIRDAGSVAEINDTLVGQLADHFPHHGQATHPGIEYSHGRRAAHLNARVARSPAPRGAATTPMFALKSQSLAATYASAPEKRWLKTI